METRYLLGRAGTRTQESGLTVHTCRSAWALESGSSAALVGAGRIGDLTGTTDRSSTTTTPTPRTAEPLSIAATSLMGLWNAVARAFMAAHLSEVLAGPPMDFRRHIALVACIPERSVVSIMEVSRGGTPSAGGRASEAASTVAADFTGVVAEGSTRSPRSQQIPDNSLRRKISCSTVWLTSSPYLRGPDLRQRLPLSGWF